MAERDLQEDVLLEYMCRAESEGGLGYRRTEPTLVNSGEMVIPSQLAEFVKRADAKAWQKLARKYKVDERKLTREPADRVARMVRRHQNAAIALNQNKSFTFQDVRVPLLKLSNSALNEDRDFALNIFAAVSECPVSREVHGRNLYAFRPDVALFVNGIFFSYIELKSVSEGPDAEREGRCKVCGDYLNAVKALTMAAKRDESVETARRKVLAPFHQPIHIIATDGHRTFVLRTLSSFYTEARAHFASMPPHGINEAMEVVLLPVFKEQVPPDEHVQGRERMEHIEEPDSGVHCHGFGGYAAEVRGVPARAGAN